MARDWDVAFASGPLVFDGNGVKVMPSHNRRGSIAFASRTVRGALLALIAVVGLFAMPAYAGGPRDGLQFAPDQILVKFKAGVAAAAAKDVHANQGGVLIGAIPKIGVQIVKVPAGKVQAMLAAYKADKSVEFAEPDHVVRAYGVNDPSFSKQYGMTKVLAPQAWGITKGSAQVKIV